MLFYFDEFDEIHASKKGGSCNSRLRPGWPAPNGLLFTMTFPSCLFYMFPLLIKLYKRHNLKYIKLVLQLVDNGVRSVTPLPRVSDNSKENFYQP